MSWNPDRYLQFKKERAEPFRNLLQLANIRANLKILDLGCGTGEMALELANTFPNSYVVGIDSSPEMLDKATEIASPQLHFELKKIEDITGSWDIIFSNSALHWVENHHSFMPKLFSMLSPQGQLLSQFPSSHRNQAHKAIQKIAQQELFRKAMDNWQWNFPVLEIETYAEIFYKEGAQKTTVFDKVYSHVLEDANAVFDWVSGTTILPYLKKLPKELHDIFKKECQKQFLSIWPSGPLLFPFRRVLLSVVKQG